MLKGELRDSGVLYVGAQRDGVEDGSLITCGGLSG